MGFMPIGGSFRGRDDGDDKVPLPKAYWAKYHLTEQQGKAVQEILNRYVGELEEQKTAANRIDGELTWNLGKDIDYITGLAKLFD